nr:DUF975 family protein [Lentilactobacillus kisonensis]
MDRPTLKKDAKSILNSHFQFYFLLWLPVFILEIIGGFLYAPDVRDGDAFTASQDIGLFITLLAAIMAIGIYYVSIDAIRQTLQYDKPLQKSFTVFARGEYFLGTILLYILIFIFTFLWSLLLVIPGIIKGIAYSQAYYIYRDAIDQDKPISYLEAITRSRELMNGHKWEYFVMSLSFIGWLLVVLITAGIATIWVQPYMVLSFANFYNELIEQSADQDNQPTIETTGPTNSSDSDQ